MRRLIGLQLCLLATLASTVQAGASDSLPLPTAAASSDSSASKQVLLPIQADGEFGFVDASGHVVVQPEFVFAYPFSDGLSLVVYPPIRGPLANRIHVDTDGKSREAFVDRLGQKKFAVKYEPVLQKTGISCSERPLGAFSEGLVPVRVEHPGQQSNLGYVNEAGALAFEGRYHLAEDFSEGLAAVQEADPASLRWGFVDQTGDVAIPLRFKNARSFTDGLAAVQDQTSGLWGYADRTGAYVIPPKFQGAWPFSEGRAVVALDGGRTLIDRTGIPEGPPAPSVGRYSMGLAPFNAGGQSDDDDIYPDSAVGGQWGYRDAMGKVVIAPQFAYARPFEGGFAAVNVGGKNHSSVFPEGNVEGGKWGYIDATGRIVIEPKYQEAAGFRLGFAAVEKSDGRCTYIDRSGKEVAVVGLRDPAGATIPEAARRGVRGRALIKSIDLARLGASDLIAVEFTRALVSTSRSKTRSYDLDHQGGLGTDLKSMVTSAPRLRSGAVRPQVRAPEVRAERTVLQRSLSKCENDDDADDIEQCKLLVKADDYENFLNDRYTTAVSTERHAVSLRLGGAARQRLESRLSRMMDGLRQRLEKGSSLSAVKAKLQHVAVTISPSSDTNVVAEFRSPTLEIPTGLLLDVYLRAVHRAVVDLRARNVDFDPEDFCQTCTYPASRSGIFSLDYKRLAHLENRLPHFRVTLASSHAMAKAIERRCQASRPEEREDVVRILSSGKDGDPRDKAPGAMPAVERYLACASGAPVSDVQLYLDEPKRLDEDEGFDGTPFKDYALYTVEKVQLELQISAEMTKALTFILAHEGYHLWTSSRFGPEAEYAADAQALDIYYKAFGRNDIAAMISENRGFEAVGTSGAALAQSFFEVMGRDPVTLLREVYAGTDYYGGNESHPPVALRVARVKRMMERKKLTFSCGSHSEDANLTPGSGAPDAIHATSHCRLSQERSLDAL